MSTPAKPRTVEQLDLQAIVAAWTVPGPAPDVHRRAQEKVRRQMPVLARALDRAAQHVTARG